MNLDHAQTSPPTDQARLLTDTSLRGCWLVLARVVWSVLALFTLGVFIASMPANFALLKMPCTGLECTVASGQLTASALQALQKSGLSIDKYALYWIALNAVVALIWCMVGGVLVWRKSNEWLVLLVALMLVTAGTGFVAVNLLLSPSTWRIPENWLYAIQSLAVLYTFALFPNGRPVPRWIGWVPLLYPAQLICYLLFLSQLHLFDWSLYRSPLNAISWFGCEAVLVVAQLYRYFRVSDRVERQQTKWVAFSFLIVLIADFGGAAASNLLSIERIGLLYVLILSLFTCLFLVFPISIGIAILRYRLWDIDIIIRRTLVYSALTACIVGIYVFVVGYLGALLRTGSNLLISLIAAGLVAVLFQPLRERLQRGVNRLFYGQRDEPYAVITRLSQRLEATLTPDTILSTIVETLAQALKLPYAAILLQDDGVLTIAARYGELPTQPLTFLLVYQRETIGQLQLAPRSPGEAFTPADLHLLNELTHQVSLAAHTVRLTADLRRSNGHLQAARERLVTTREEERRRLRRDLHDGLGPTLAALALTASTVSDLIPTNPSAAAALADSLQNDIRTTVGDIRRLVYDLRPPALDELGLIPAIRERVALLNSTQHKETGLAFPARLLVQVDTPEKLPALPAAVEVAAYRIVQEALTNVMRHAQARNCRISLALTDVLEMKITDDGIGLPNDVQPGVGLFSMRERAAELGGECAIEKNQGGGTCVCARLPFAKE